MTLEPSTTRRSFTAAEVADAFKQETGDELRVDEFAAGISPVNNAARLGFEGPVEEAEGEIQSEPAHPALHAKYGTFSIFVGEDAAELRLSSFGEPDEAGRFWVAGVPERGPNAGRRVWSVYKIYGLNVRLGWFPDDRSERQLDARWHRLDRALSRLDRDP